MKYLVLILFPALSMFNAGVSLAAGSDLYNTSYLPGDTRAQLEESKRMQEDRRRNPGAYYETPGGYVKGTPPPPAKKQGVLDDPSTRRQLQLLEDMLNR